MTRVSTCLWFGKDLEAAIRFYVALVPGSSLDHLHRSPGDWPGGRAGDVMMAVFTLSGQRFQALNGGAAVDYANAVSIAVTCPDQAEVDRLWNALTADGGTENPCGWLRDRWGVPWQIIPDALPRLMGHPDPAVSGRVFAALRGMSRIDIAALERAARDGTADG